MNRIICFALAFVILGGCRQEVKPNAASESKPAALLPAVDTQPVPVAEMKLVWADEFDGDSLDSNHWKFETGAGGWGNNELQNYTDGANAEVKDGILRITAKMTGEQATLGNFTSTRLNSKKSFQFGRLEVKARIPELKGNGIWPAIWMLPDSFPKTSWPLCGEIDIMEYVSCTPDKVHFTVHSKAHNHTTGTHKNSGPIDLPTIDEQFHVYGFLWSQSKIKFYLDTPENIQFTVTRPEKATMENWPFDQPFYFVLNIAVGGAWGGLKGVEPKAFPSTMEIDYVRVYQ